MYRYRCIFNHFRLGVPEILSECSILLTTIIFYINKPHLIVNINQYPWASGRSTSPFLSARSDQNCSSSTSILEILHTARSPHWRICHCRSDYPINEFVFRLYRDAISVRFLAKYLGKCNAFFFVVVDFSFFICKPSKYCQSVIVNIFLNVHCACHEKKNKNTIIILLKLLLIKKSRRRFTRGTCCWLTRKRVIQRSISFLDERETTKRKLNNNNNNRTKKQKARHIGGPYFTPRIPADGPSSWLKNPCLAKKKLFYH